MKKFWLCLQCICLGLLAAGCSEDEVPAMVAADAVGSFVDERDGTVYHYLRFGDQEWTCENARYIIPNIDVCNFYQPLDWEWGMGVFETLDTCYYGRYGCLYSIDAAREAVPEGWRLPTDEDWQNLERHFGMSAEEAASLDWRGNVAPLMLAETEDNSSLGILLGGYYTEYTSGGRLGWRYMSVYGYYWTDTPDPDKGSSFYFARKFCYNNAGIWRHSMEIDHYKMYVRFVRDVQ